MIYQEIEITNKSEVPRTGSYLAIYPNGTKIWYFNGRYHRDNGPALDDISGFKIWFINGFRHRVNEPAIECSDGSKGWLVNGKFHRTNGPAYDMGNGYKAWHIHGKRHRIDGPAMEWSTEDGGADEWWIDHKRYSEEEWLIERELWIQKELKDKLKEQII